MRIGSQLMGMYMFMYVQFFIPQDLTACHCVDGVYGFSQEIKIV